MIGQLLRLTGGEGRVLLRRMLVFGVLAAVIQGLAFLALVPLLTALLAGDGPGTARWLWVLAGIAAAYAVTYAVDRTAGNRAGMQVLASLLDRLGSRLVELPVGWFAKDRSGALADTATRGITFAASAASSVALPLVSGFVTPATIAVGTLFIDWRLAVAMACVAPVLLLVYRRTARGFEGAVGTHVDALGVAGSRLVEFARVQPALRAAGDGRIGRDLVADALADQHAANAEINRRGGRGVGVFGTIVQVALVGLLVLTVALCLGMQLSVPAAIALLVLTIRFVDPMIQAAALSGGIRVARNTLTQIEELVDTPTLPEPETPRSPQGFGVELDDVTFGYGATPVLRGLTMRADDGAMTAIVGPSGSGKTTITRLVARFWDPEGGTVRIGGVPLPELGSDAVRAAVAPVFQDVYLFDGTIRDNVRLGRPDATDAQVEAASAAACVDEIVARLPHGWDTRVGEGGTNLSGGERQRISIARALLKDAPIVLLDEATSALDVHNEQALQRSFDAVRAGRTLIVVAHRLSTIAAADRIVMLDETGRVAEQGTHDELLAAGGRYAGYWAQRTQAAGWRLEATS